jgi:mannose/cellobiose epimerase-like protein (N-acyl-D-glucosamine 2-epimerase family)
MSDEFNPRDTETLRTYVDRILGFYDPTCIDRDHGGYVAQFDEESGKIYDNESKHLVATSRFIANYCVAEQVGQHDWGDSAAEHGLEFLMGAQWDDERRGFHWLVEGTNPVESRRVCYGHAFGLLALSWATEVGIDDADQYLKEVYKLVDNHFWEPEHGLCKSEFDANWSTTISYRGQNANMHMCEAMIAAYEATHDQRYLDHALTIAESLLHLTKDTDGLIWEHYTEDWEPDFDYNRDDPTHTFRPWGFQPGHQIEWAKLLTTLSRFVETDWLVKRAKDLFDDAIRYGWDDSQGGFYYSIDLDREPVVTDKYSWEVAEAIGAAVALYDQTGVERYLNWYDTFWTYAKEILINPQYGNWYSKVTEDNQPVPMTDGVAVEPGYHPIGACLEGIRSL